MAERPRVEEERGDADEEQPFERALRERLRSLKSATERRTVAGLARELGRLPAETARAALEISASVASVSLRAGVEFLRGAPDAARVLDAQELRAWGEMGRRLAMADAELGANFFAAGVAELEVVPRAARPPLFQVCARQMTLSSSVALETFRRAPELAEAVEDGETLRAVYEVAVEIARRSAKHSADFLNATPLVAASLYRFDTYTAETTQERRAHEAAGDAGEGLAMNQVARRAVSVAGAFAARAGGIASEMWSALPDAVEALDERAALRLLAHAESFLERGGAAALHAFVAGGEVLRAVPEAFDAWAALLHAIGEQSNAGLVALARSTPQFFRTFAARTDHVRAAELARRIIAAAHRVAQVDAEAAISCFRSGPQALATNSVEQFEQWAAEGLRRDTGNARARRSYFALETRQSNESLHGSSAGAAGLALEEVAQTLRLYVEALTGHAVDVAPLAAVPEEARIGDGRTIHLPASVSEFADEALDFRLYKVLAAHAAGQIEFGTHARETPDLRAAYASLAELYAPENQDARDAFALDGYINDLSSGERALSPAEEAREAARLRRVFPADGDYRAVLALFPQAALAARIFGTLENGRIDHRLRLAYRGLARDLDLVRTHLRARRPRIASVPVTLVPFELLFQITLCGGALDDARSFYGQVVSELESIVADYLTSPRSTVADTLMATSRVYTLFQSVVPEITERHHESDESQGDADEDSAAQNNLAREDEGDEEDSEEQREQRRQRSEQSRDARELFNAWASAESLDTGGEEMFTGAERWASGESPEQELAEGEVAYNYDEWDRELSDHRTGWCRVIEKTVGRGDPSFVDETRARYRGVISSIRHQFQLMKPESLKRVTNELDGDDYDLSAVVDYVTDRRSSKAGGGHPSERLYTKRLRRERDVAVSFLLDQSSSTARTIGRHPLQPYTHPGRRIIEVEKEGLVLMSEALDAVGDPFSIYGFTSEGRRNVKFYVVKDFNEQYTSEVERRIGGINYQHNTRLGAAVRHASARLLRQEARTRLLIVLSDGRPYDHDYGDARYAREDTREALRQARADGVTPFCITIDRDSETELRDLYGEVGYTIIDDVLSLPERLPAIYRRLTT
ncbi:MAG TPA: VWA domain-containing protein [Pyrinomonadaceae bacterium]|nr:VWA domain-containing protein [Pyrinomonadaceae bacterium]